MRQVPQYTVIGDGKLARQIRAYFHLKKIPYSKWKRSNPQSSLAEALESASHVLILISDSAIENFIDTHETLLRHKVLVHFSGSLLSRKAFSTHPLQSFAFAKFDAEEFERIPFMLEEEGPSFSELLPGFTNPHFRIPGQDKAYYHSLCVMANNFTTLLWQKLFREFEGRWNIPSTAAFPILEQTLFNLKTDFRKALTGPLARGDESTLQRNTKALEGDAFQAIFENFINIYKTSER